MGPRSFEGLMTLFEGGRTIFGVKTNIYCPLECLTDKLSFLGERLPFADSAGDHELSSGRRLPFTDSIGESLVDLLGDSELFSLTKKWHLSTLLGKYQAVFQEEKRPLVNYVEESTLLGEENCSSTLWGMQNRLSYPNKIVECRFVGESRLRNSKSEQTISLRETTIY